MRYQGWSAPKYSFISAMAKEHSWQTTHKTVPPRERSQGLINVGVHFYCYSSINALLSETWALITVKSKKILFKLKNLIWFTYIWEGHLKMNQRPYLLLLLYHLYSNKGCIIYYKLYPFPSFILTWTCWEMHWGTHTYVCMYNALSLYIYRYMYNLYNTGYNICTAT